MDVFGDLISSAQSYTYLFSPLKTDLIKCLIDFATRSEMVLVFLIFEIWFDAQRLSQSQVMCYFSPLFFPMMPVSQESSIFAQSIQSYSLFESSKLSQ